MRNWQPHFMSPLKKISTTTFEIGLPPPQNSPASHTEARKANRENPCTLTSVHVDTLSKHTLAEVLAVSQL